MSKSSKRWDIFMEHLFKLDVVEFIGVAKMLGIDVVSDPKDFEAPGKEFPEVFAEILDKFNALDRRKQRNLLKIMKKAGKK